MPREPAIAMPTAKSATSSVKTSGVLETLMPFEVAQATSIVSHAISCDHTKIRECIHCVCAERAVAPKSEGFNSFKRLFRQAAKRCAAQQIVYETFRRNWLNIPVIIRFKCSIWRCVIEYPIREFVYPRRSVFKGMLMSSSWVFLTVTSASIIFAVKRMSLATFVPAAMPHAYASFPIDVMPKLMW